MNIISKLQEKLKFTFSFKRLFKAIALIIIFTLIGASVFLFYEFETSENGLKKLYIKEIEGILELNDKEIIKINKADIDMDRKEDYLLIVGNEKRSNASTLNSVVEIYEKVDFYIINGNTKEVYKHETNQDFGSDVQMKTYFDEQEKYVLVSDSKNKVALFKLFNGKIINYIGNTTNKEFLGYTIYTKQVEDNILEVNIDNYGKDYLKEYREVKKIDFNELGLSLKNYRETYLRDGFSKFELKDTDRDGILEFIGYQYVLYTLNNTRIIENSEKTVGEIMTIFKIVDDKLKHEDVIIEF